MTAYASWLRADFKDVDILGQYNSIVAGAARAAEAKAQGMGRVAEKIAGRIGKSTDEVLKRLVAVDYQIEKSGRPYVYDDGRVSSSAGLPRCTQGVKLFERGCGHRQAVVIRCGRPVCPECESIRAREAMEEWRPVVEAMRWPKMLVLAVKSDEVLLSSMFMLQFCFGRFLDLRIGGRAREEHKARALEFVREHAAEFDSHHDEGAQRKSSAEWEQSVIRFVDKDLKAVEQSFHDEVKHAESALLKLEGEHALADELKPAVKRLDRAQRTWKRVSCDGLKVRDLLYGFRALEVTHSSKGWHPHFHCLVDAVFLPFPIVLTWWMEASTVDGECHGVFGDVDDDMSSGEVIGRTAHISAVKSVKECIKYVTKHQDYKGQGTGLELVQERELEAVLFRRKRIWPIGSCRPTQLPKAPCPGCGDSHCSCTPRGTLTDYLGDDTWAGPVGVPVRVVRQAKKGLVWEEVQRDAPSPLLNTVASCLTGGARVLALLDAALGPPRSQNGALVG